MSRVLFKSMIYKDGKVFTRQCSSNVKPKYYILCEHIAFTRMYNSVGERNFEKWFLCNCIMGGYVEILKGSNKVLRRLNYIATLLYKDKNYLELRNNLDIFSNKILSAENEIDNRECEKNYKAAIDDIEHYVSIFYDKHDYKNNQINKKNEKKYER